VVPTGCGGRVRMIVTKEAKAHPKVCDAVVIL